MLVQYLMDLLSNKWLNMSVCGLKKKKKDYVAHCIRDIISENRAKRIEMEFKN